MGQLTKIRANKRKMSKIRKIDKSNQKKLNGETKLF